MYIYIYIYTCIYIQIYMHTHTKISQPGFKRRLGRRKGRYKRQSLKGSTNVSPYKRQSNHSCATHRSAPSNIYYIQYSIYNILYTIYYITYDLQPPHNSCATHTPPVSSTYTHILSCSTRCGTRSLSGKCGYGSVW